MAAYAAGAKEQCSWTDELVNKAISQGTADAGTRVNT